MSRCRSRTGDTPETEALDLRPDTSIASMKKRILIVEDDRALARVLADNLTFAGYEVEHLDDGADVVSKVRSFSPDLVLLDVMLPGKDGFGLLGLIRQGGRTPVIMLTARDQKTDKLKGLELGADDYVTKPFDFEELQARIRAVLRRARRMVTRITVGEAIIDFENFKAMRGRHDLRLSRREFDLLLYLAEREGGVVPRSELLREVWGFPEEPATRAVDYAIRRLRRKIETDPHHPRHIHTVHGDGYCLTLEAGR
jgi:DNA-binding response OmpR family regulator